MVFHSAPCSPALGPARRHLHVFEEISRRHTVSIVTFARDGERERFEREHQGRYERALFVSKRPRLVEMLIASWYLLTGRSVFRRLYTRRMQRAIDDAILGGRFDLIYFSTVLLGCYRVPTHVRVVADSHNVEHEVLARSAVIAQTSLHKAYFHAQSIATRRDEQRLARIFSEIWTTSERDAQHFAAVRGDSRVAVVPNGIRPDQAPRSSAAHAVRPAPVLLFVGLMSYFPNRDAVTYFLDRIFPRIQSRIPQARFVVVGAAPPRSVQSRATDNVTIVGRVATVVPYLAEAAVFVAPLRSGGGTRVKVLEAMLHGVPVVSTSLACEGLAVRDGESILVGDTPDAFAEAVCRLCADPALARRIATAGARLVRAEYDWRRIGESIDRLLVPAVPA
jgi:glycosyltransferase involved in cell wall biosynthesis